MAEDSIENVAGTGLTLELGGKSFELSPASVDDMAEFAAWVRAKSLQAFVDADTAIDPATRIQVIAELSSRPLPADLIETHMQSIAGMRYMIWLSLRKKNPDMTLEQVSEMIDAENVKELHAVTRSIGGTANINPTEDKTEES